MRKRGSRVSSGKNNAAYVKYTNLIVVNCFRISIFAVAKTISRDLYDVFLEL